MKKYLNIRDLSPDQPIYVKSSVGFGNKNLVAGDVSIEVSFQDGKRELIVIPRTFIPYCLTELAPFEFILNSSSFRKAVASGLLRIIDPDAAEEELNTPEGREEQERLRQEYFSGIDFTSDKQVTAAPVTPVEALTKMEEAVKSVNPRIQQIMIVSNMSDQDKLRQLRIESDSVTDADLEFITGLVTKNSPILKWVEELKTKRSEKIEE